MIEEMRVARAVLDYLAACGVKYLFGIPAGSVNALFDELYDMPQIEPVVVKHEGAAGYMAAAYARAAGQLAVCVGSSGPGATNLLTGAANAMREHLPVLFLTGHVPVPTEGLNASQELAADPLFRPVTKWSVTVREVDEVLSTIARAVETAYAGVPGPVHVALPIDVQLAELAHGEQGERMASAQPSHAVLPPERVQARHVPTQWPPVLPSAGASAPDAAQLRAAAEFLSRAAHGFVFVGQGARRAVDEVMAVAWQLGWPIVSSPQAKGLIPTDEPGYMGIYGFAGDDHCASFVHSLQGGAMLVVGSSLGETATNNYNTLLAAGRVVVQIDIDPTVFNRAYRCDAPLTGDAAVTLRRLLDILRGQDAGRAEYAGDPEDACAAERWVDEGGMDSAPAGGVTSAGRGSPGAANRAFSAAADHAGEARADDYNTANVLTRLQALLPRSTRYVVDIGEFMSYVIHGMKVYERHTFDINVHFGPMGIALSSAIGWALADRERPVVSITGDGCFFMHGMEVLTARELRLPVLWVVFNNARLGMVHHGHRLQYGRAHGCFSQMPVDIAAMAAAMGIVSARVEGMADLSPDVVASLLDAHGPALLEIALVDEHTPPMGDRVKFLSSFGPA